MDGVAQSCCRYEVSLEGLNETRACSWDEVVKEKIYDNYQHKWNYYLIDDAFT